MATQVIGVIVAHEYGSHIAKKRKDAQAHVPCPPAWLLACLPAYPPVLSPLLHPYLYAEHCLGTGALDRPCMQATRVASSFITLLGSSTEPSLPMTSRRQKHQLPTKEHCRSVSCVLLIWYLAERAFFIRPPPLSTLLSAPLTLLFQASARCPGLPA